MWPGVKSERVKEKGWGRVRVQSSLHLVGGLESKERENKEKR
jgi:hypothetical protein